MNIDLKPEDQERLDALVASGRFNSKSDALHAGIEALQEDEEWKSYAQDRIEAGLADLEAGRVVPVEEVLEMLRAARQQKA